MARAATLLWSKARSRRDTSQRTAARVAPVRRTQQIIALRCAHTVTSVK